MLETVRELQHIPVLSPPQVTVMNTMVLHLGDFTHGTSVALKLATCSVFQSPAHPFSHLDILRKEQMLVDLSNCVPLGAGLFSSEKSFFAQLVSF